MGRDVAVDAAAVRRDEALHAEADAEHRAAGAPQHLASDREVGGVRRVAGTGREHDVGVAQHLVGVHLVVLDDARQQAGDGGDEVDEVPRVGVVVVHDDHVRCGHRLNLATLPGTGERGTLHEGLKQGA